jgi:hypothetical protein
MLNKPYIMCGLMLSVGLGTPISAAIASACRPIVAEIQKKTDAIDQVGILRASQGNVHEWASLSNRTLCPGDVVIVPKTLRHLKLDYYSNSGHQETLTAGDRHEVIALGDPCGALCKFQTKIKRLWDKLWNTEPPKPTRKVATKGHDKSQHLFTPLADGEGSKEPFYLFARDGAIPLIWKGGESPYRLTVKNADGDVVVQETIESAKILAEFVLSLPDTESGSVYRLTIQSAKDKACRKNKSKICDKALKLIVPPFPLDPRADQRMMLATLLADCDRNWLLEIWRQLNAMPDSQQKLKAVGHLIANNISPFDRDIGLCR